MVASFTKMTVAQRKSASGRQQPQQPQQPCMRCRNNSRFGANSVIVAFLL